MRKTKRHRRLKGIGDKQEGKASLGVSWGEMKTNHKYGPGTKCPRQSWDRRHCCQIPNGTDRGIDYKLRSGQGIIANHKHAVQKSLQTGLGSWRRLFVAF